MVRKALTFSEAEITAFHEEMLYPVVRIQAKTALGSGSIIYSNPKKETPSEFETYILTNHHVIESAITQVEKWSSLLQRKYKGDVFADIDVEIFEYQYESWEPTHHTIPGEIITYDQDQDLGLVRLKTVKPMSYIAKLLPKGESKEKLRMFMTTLTVGSGLGEEPFPSVPGMLASLNRRIANTDGKGYTFHLSSSPSIYGNSGGACFLMDTHEMIGIPSRIAVTGRFGSDAITHMGYIIPIERVYQFFKAELLHFLYDPTYTSDQCFELRKKRREEDKKRMAIDISRDGDTVVKE